VLGGIFPTLSGYVQANSPERVKEFSEYRAVVEYHLNCAEQASRDASSALYRVRWGFNALDASNIYVIDQPQQNLIRFGDSAIREASSVIDTCLSVVNFALNLGLHPKKMRWTHRNPKYSIKESLSSLQVDAGALIEAIDKTFASIGYELLNGYRNWVTHRGAPSATFDYDQANGLLLPAEVVGEQDANAKKFRVETHLAMTVSRLITVRCYPFVQPVQSVLNVDVKDAPTDMNIAGVISLGKGSSVSIQDMRMVAGSHMDNASEFRSKNPILIAKEGVRVAGEDIAAYSAMDYLMALGSVVRFSERVIAEWDSNLSATCDVLARHAKRDAP
jgi:hypothetical protein